eukprot:CCRYP_006380-RA/>CCRYP_006380-RA protein AED:0.05 eAED:0.05 QI:275/1/1/1/1/1/2/159/134
MNHSFLSRRFFFFFFFFFVGTSIHATGASQQTQLRGVTTPIIGRGTTDEHGNRSYGHHDNRSRTSKTHGAYYCTTHDEYGECVWPCSEEDTVEMDRESNDFKMNGLTMEYFDQEIRRCGVVPPTAAVVASMDTF